LEYKRGFEKAAHQCNFKKKKKKERVSVWSVPATERDIAPASGCSYSVLYYKTESNFLFSLLPALSHGTASSYINIKIK
jgi:hypothetical protein